MALHMMNLFIAHCLGQSTTGTANYVFLITQYRYMYIVVRSQVIQDIKPNVKKVQKKIVRDLSSRLFGVGWPYWVGYDVRACYWRKTKRNIEKRIFPMKLFFEKRSLEKLHKFQICHYNKSGHLEKNLGWWARMGYHIYFSEPKNEH